MNAVFFPVLIALSAIFFFILEKWRPARKLPESNGWLTHAVLINLASLAILQVTGAIWQTWFDGFSIMSLSGILHPAFNGLIAYVLFTFAFYWWHLWQHRSGLLWRIFHQVHHSPRRIEVLTSYYHHPLAMIIGSLIGGFLTFIVIGDGAEAAGWLAIFTATAGFFNHANIRTPYWLGYVFQRPEMHRKHHQYGKHRNNYSDIVIWDMLFGTYENPKVDDWPCGFDSDQESQLARMLACKEV